MSRHFGASRRESVNHGSSVYRAGSATRPAHLLAVADQLVRIGHGAPQVQLVATGAMYGVCRWSGQVTDKCPAVLLGVWIGLAMPGRPIGPWSRRTGAPQASATGRDRTPPMLTRLLTGPVATPRDER